MPLREDFALVIGNFHTPDKVWCLFSASKRRPWADGQLAILTLGTTAFLLLRFIGERFAGHPTAVHLINAGYWVLLLMALMLVDALI